MQTTNGRNYQTSTQYLAYGSPEQELAMLISQPESVDTSISYNLFGNPVSITQGGVVESRVYDNAQRLCLQKRPETGIKALQYNNLGQITGYAEGLTGNGSSCSDYTANTNAWVAIAYDNHGVERGKTFADGSPAVTNTLDAQGNLLTLAAGNSTWTYTYNSKHLVESELLNVSGVNFVLNPEYDSLGNLASLQYNNQLTASYAPNALGQPMQLTDGFATLAGQVQYHPDGKLKSFNYGNGLRFNQSVDIENRPYERAVLQSQNYKVAQRYGYDANNNIEAITDLVASNRSVSMQYDGLDRLDSATGAWGYGSFDYDVLGNLTAKTVGSTTSYYNYNTTTNRLSSVTGGYNFSYDDRGNVSHNGKRAFTFNRANQLVGSGNVSYVYDGYNRRVRQQTAAGTNYSLYNSGGQLMLRQNPAAVRTFALYLGKDLIAERDISATTNTLRYQHTDVLGSVIAESNSAGAITSSSVYQPFGERIGGQKVGVGFTGHLEDPDIELTYMQQRYYDPVIGRFYSNDPVGFGADNPMMFNRYAYANNNPYKYVDPDGMEVRSVYNDETNTLSMRDQDTKERVVIDAFSGGSYSDGDFEPIPEGTYAILFSPRDNFFRLEAIDSKFGDDIEETTGRTQFRLHHFGRSEGCVTAKDDQGWQKVKKMLKNTSTTSTTVDSKSKNPFAEKTESSVKYGELKVVRVSGRINSKRLEK
ncbi:MAG: RHS repeat-associated core domain-containing protein [Rheinheimera sp.]|nr:RHS repeat-associated core domain-containing protein [Rheinheimera sp.]